MAAGLSHKDTKAQRGTKACAIPEIFVFLRALVFSWHPNTLLLSSPCTTTPQATVPRESGGQPAAAAVGAGKLIILGKPGRYGRLLFTVTPPYVCT
jgi:hypothetical protein